METKIFTSESVTCGHPDKVCDQIADAILDEILKQDKMAHVACEVSAIMQKIHIFGEITSAINIDYKEVARKVMKDIGYTKEGYGFDVNNCVIRVNLHEQSPDIAQGIYHHEEMDNGAGDQGMMFGYACDETSNYMPLPIELAHRLAKRLELVRKTGILPYLLPDGKTQVSVAYENDIPKKITSVVVSTQHEDEIDIKQVREDITNFVILPILSKKMIDKNTQIFINPTGRFVKGGPAADSGLTGRKLMVDTYGGYARHGGGSFSGKDASKVDRSGAYLARYIAKNIVASKLASRCEVQLSYAIGLAEPVSLYIDTFHTEKVELNKIKEAILKNIDMRPNAIIQKFHLKEPNFYKVSCYGHFGENAKEMPWEKTDLVEILKNI